MFDRRTAEEDLRRLRQDGPPWATRTLVDALASGMDLSKASVIDIGAGVGAVHLGLLERGARSATDIDGSSAYLDAAREEAGRLGLAERVRHVLGDATVVGMSLAPADIVALDRVVCCYGGLTSLLDVASSLTRRRLGLVYPRDAWWVRAGVAILEPDPLPALGGLPDAHPPREDDLRPAGQRRVRAAQRSPRPSVAGRDVGARGGRVGLRRPARPRAAGQCSRDFQSAGTRPAGPGEGCSSG